MARTPTTLTRRVSKLLEIKAQMDRFGEQHCALTLDTSMLTAGDAAVVIRNILLCSVGNFFLFPAVSNYNNGSGPRKWCTAATVALFFFRALTNSTMVDVRSVHPE